MPKNITTLTSPGPISEQTIEILQDYYEDVDSIILLSDGLHVRRDEEDSNTFYVCAPMAVTKERATEIATYVESVLVKGNSIPKPRIIFLPEGIEQKLI